MTGTVKSATSAKGADPAGRRRRRLPACFKFRERVEDIRSHVKEGDTVEVMIINVDRKTRNISLSIKAEDSAEEAEAASVSTRVTTTQAMPVWLAFGRCWAKQDGNKAE